MKKGTRCTICTGCGRCFGEQPGGLKILSVTDLAKETVTALSHSCKAASHPGSTLSHPVICADIGTTTVAMICADPDGHVTGSYLAVNPQGKFGADVISRIKASADPGIFKEMKNSVRGVLSEGVKKFIREGVISSPVKMYVSANTTMTYLLMGYDPAELGTAPFTASHTEGGSFILNISGTGGGSFIPDSPASGSESLTSDALLTEVEITVLPGYSAFVGGDIYSGVTASSLTSSDKYRLLCDLGTNGEIALGNKDRLYVTATAAGPAFEGGPCKGVWGADMISLAAVLLKEGYMDKTGLLKDPYFEDGIDIGNVHITQESIRALQLAKAAMNAGIRIICSKAGISYDEIETCILAGGFGISLKPEDASYIGLLPEELKDKCISGGNTALKGTWSYACGVRPKPCAEIINLALEPGFNELYMNSLSF